MKNKWYKKALALSLVTVLAVTGLAGCGSKSSSKDPDAFTWWIFSTDGVGKYYENYEDNPVAQYVAAQYWDSENGGIGTKDSGTQLKLSYQVPVTGSESDNFNTMLSTGEYPEIMSLMMSNESPQSLCESGILMEITEYVEKYMPNYLAYLDANPQMKPMVSTQDEDGKTHYYALYSLNDGVPGNWEGTCYRRDWLVKYATPSEYVWDWDSSVVQTNGHPDVTPLAKAKSTGNLNGWKKNTVTSFTSNDGADPNNDYTDNVIFPSGTGDPITISDWEWMMEAFEKAINDRGWQDDSSSYCYTVMNTGAMTLGDVVSSFGGGNGDYYADKEGNVSYDGTSDNFKTYVETMQNWYEKGWLDQQFSSRTETFYQINTTGVNQGKVGMWCGLLSTLGSTIRSTCADKADAKDAFVMGCALPINDTYGTDVQKFKDPDSLFQSGRVGPATGITTKAEGKDLATLFTFIDWTYTFEGGMTMRQGLSEEQYQSVTLDPDLYAEYDMTSGYTVSKDEDGRTMYTRVIDDSNDMCNAVNGQRMDVGIVPVKSDEYWINNGAPSNTIHGAKLWDQFLNTGSVLDYKKLLSSKESAEYAEVTSQVSDYVSMNLPNVIKGTMSWDDYKAGIEKLDPNSVSHIIEKYVKAAK